MDDRADHRDDALIWNIVPLTEAELPLLHEWLNRRHVLEWWHGESSLEEVRATYLPHLDGGAVRPYIAWLGSNPVGYIQSYVAVESEDGWWVGYSDPGVLGIDQFIADPDRLNQGLGSTLVSEFAAILFQDPNVTRLIADPRPDNSRAIRCYEKAGFRTEGVVNTPDGPALLMTLDRAPTSS